MLVCNGIAGERCEDDMVHSPTGLVSAYLMSYANLTLSEYNPSLNDSIDFAKKYTFTATNKGSEVEICLFTRDLGISVHDLKSLSMR